MSYVQWYVHKQCHYSTAMSPNTSCISYVVDFTFFFFFSVFETQVSERDLSPRCFCVEVSLWCPLDSNYACLTYRLLSGTNVKICSFGDNLLPLKRCISYSYFFFEWKWPMRGNSQQTSLALDPWGVTVDQWLEEKLSTLLNVCILVTHTVEAKLLLEWFTNMYFFFFLQRTSQSLTI